MYLMLYIKHKAFHKKIILTEIIEKLQNRSIFLLHGRVINSEIGFYKVHLRKHSKMPGVYNLYHGNWHVDNTYIFLCQHYLTRVYVLGQIAETFNIKYTDIEFCD